MLRSKLSGKNTVMTINTWAVSVMHYGAGIINWTKGELEKLDRKTRKLLTVYGMFHPCRDVDCLYLTRENGGRGLIGADECVRAEERGLAYYVDTSTEALLIAMGNEED